MKLQAHPDAVESHCRTKNEGGIGEKRAEYCVHSDSAGVLGEFQRTEAGLIPNDWRAKRLKEISPKQCVGLVINPSTYFDSAGTVPMLVGSNVSENRIDWGGAKRITTESNQQLSASRLRASDIVMVRVGDPGVAAVIPIEFDECNCASMMIVRGHHSFDSTWLCHAMNSPFGRMRVASVQYGTAQKQFNISDAVNFVYAVPPLAEQRAIAEALSDVDGLLGALDALIAKKRAIKQAATQQLLTGKTRLPGFSGGWSAKRLGYAGHCLRGVSYNGDADLSAYDTATTKRLLRANNVQGAAVVTHEVQYVNSERVSPKQILTDGDILVCLANGSKELVGKAGRFTPVDGHEYTFGAFMGCFRTTNDEVESTFVFYMFQASRYRVQVNDLLAGSSINNLKPSSIESLEFLVPEFNEQREIAAVLVAMDAEIDALELRREKTRAIKQGMMQQLLTGRVRLVPPSTAMTEVATP